MTDTSQIDLARAAPFRLGPITVEPALRQVTTTTAETLEPRVMLVLVALVAARGAIVSRDELTRQCWDGRIVGEDSISRVIARLRRLADERGDGSFRIETVVKVGYRLIGPVAQVEATTPATAESPPVDTRHASGAAPRGVSRNWALGGAGIATALALAGWLYSPPRHSRAATLAVETFTGLGTAKDAPEILQSAILSTNVPERFRAVEGPGSAADYTLTGRLVASPAGLIVYPVLRAPGARAPIWMPQIRYVERAPLSGIGSELALAARCIVEGAEEPPVDKPVAALAAWASYCELSNKSDWSDDLLLEALRATTRADPRFVSAQVSLAQTLGYHIMHSGGRDPDGVKPEAVRALNIAEKLDPDNSLVHLTRAVLTPLNDFTARERLIARALQARPTGGGDETNVLGYHLEAVGRLRDSLAAYQRNLTILPGNAIITMARAEVLSMAGRYREAYPVFVSDAAEQPDRSRVDRIWLTAAITGGDWATARRLVPTVPDDQVRAAMSPLITAMASGNQAAAYSAGNNFLPIAADTAALSALTVMALAWSGHDLAAIDAMERRFHVVGYNNSLGSLYSPGFANARQTPEFAAMVRRVGLFDYWRTSHHPPDFCAAAGAPKLCREI